MKGFLFLNLLKTTHQNVESSLEDNRTGNKKTKLTNEWLTSDTTTLVAGYYVILRKISLATERKTGRN